MSPIKVGPVKPLGKTSTHETGRNEQIIDLLDVAERQDRTIAAQFDIFAPILIGQRQVTAPFSVSQVFSKALMNILDTDRLALHIGATMALTAKYFLNGNLSVDEISDFWKAAVRYTNYVLDSDAVCSQITDGEIEKLIPITEQDPLGRLQELLGEKPVTIGSASFEQTNPIHKLILANSPHEIVEVISSSPDLKDMLQDRRNSLSESSESLDKTLTNIPGDLSSLGLTYLRAYMGDEKAFIDLTFRLLHAEEGLFLFAPIVRRIETFMDMEASLDGVPSSTKAELHKARGNIPNNGEMYLHHFPNLPELFLFLNNPQVHKKGNEGLVNYVTSCITSIDRFAHFGLEVDYRLLQQWAKIGLLTHSHKLWKYDTQGGGNSLFSKFGFKFDSKASKDFGARYIISKREKPELAIDDKTIIAFIRGGFIATNPRWGTIFIRNSSLVFGRDLLGEPAYFSKDSLTLEEIKSIDSKDDLDKLCFYCILDPSLNQDENFTSNLEKLLDEILTVKEAYAKRRFDPQSFEGDENFKGDLTPGMRELVNQMKNKLGEIKLEISDKPLPVLAIFPPKYPPEDAFNFYSTKGTPYNYLELTEEVLDEISDRLNGTWNEKQYPNSIWKQFVQFAVNHGAQMVLIDKPKKDKPLVSGPLKASYFKERPARHSTAKSYSAGDSDYSSIDMVIK